MTERGGERSWKIFSTHPMTGSARCLLPMLLPQSAFQTDGMRNGPQCGPFFPSFKRVCVSRCLREARKPVFGTVGCRFEPYRVYSGIP